MARALTIGGMIVAGLLVAAFGMDLAIGFPFSGANVMIDVGMVVSGLMLGYLSFNAMRDIR